MHEEFGSIKEVVDLTPQEVLDSAHALLTQQGYKIVQITDTSLAVNRRRREGLFGYSLRNLTVVALPQPQGGVRIKLTGDDQEGVREQQAAWSEWAKSLPKKEARETDSEAVQQLETAHEVADSNTEASITEEEPRGWAPAAPWERKLKAAVGKSEQGLSLPKEAPVEETSPNISEAEEPETSISETTTSKVVEAESFRLVNKEGKLRASLTIEDDQPRFLLMDQHENIRLTLSVDSDGSPTLALMDTDDRTRIRLALRYDDLPALDFVDDAGRPRLRLTLEEGQLPAITLIDEHGRSSVEDPRTAAEPTSTGNRNIAYPSEQASRATTPYGATIQPTPDTRDSTASPGLVVGDTVIMPSGAKLTVHSYESPVPPPSHIQPESGYEFSAIDVEGYTGPNPENYLDYLQWSDFTLQMPDNTRLRDDINGITVKQPDLVGNRLVPGDSIRGWITFQTPKGQKPKFAVYTKSEAVIKWAL